VFQLCNEQQSRAILQRAQANNATALHDALLESIRHPIDL
jgi:hypothetical protein